MDRDLAAIRFGWWQCTSSSDTVLDCVENGSDIDTRMYKLRFRKDTITIITNDLQMHHNDVFAIANYPQRYHNDGFAITNDLQRYHNGGLLNQTTLWSLIFLLLKSRYLYLG